MRRRELLLMATAMMAARAVRAQQKAMPVIGYLGGAAPEPFAPFVAAFRQGLQDTGYVEGQNLAIEYRWADGRLDRLPELAADLVSRKVDVIATSGGPAPARAAKNATATIPIVFVAGDPVEQGLVASLARPGGNLTGFSIMSIEVWPKRLELISEIVPHALAIGLLVNRSNSSVERVIVPVQEAARAKGLQLHIVNAATDADLETAFATLAEGRVSGLVVGTDPFFNGRREEIVALAARHAVPAVYEWREFAHLGGLISYGSSLSGSYRQAGAYVGRILKGAKPADLPVQQPTTFELVVNLSTAKALGLTVPPSILARADEVIE
jgi:putative ABC transport system substrate-binding protein